MIKNLIFFFFTSLLCSYFNGVSSVILFNYKKKDLTIVTIMAMVRLLIFL